MRRGQAFEVFRLLIAAVIAGAILMVLLSVLGGLTITTQAPDDFIKQAIKSMATEGGVRTSNTIVFKNGMAVNLAAAAGAAVLDVGCVDTYVDATLPWSCDSSTHLCDYSGGSQRGYIRVVCNPITGTGQKVGKCSTAFDSTTCSLACCVEFHKAA